MSNVKLSRKELGRKGTTPPHSPNRQQEQQQQQQQRNESPSLSSSLSSRSKPASPNVNSKTKKKRSLLKHSASKILRGTFLKKKKKGRTEDDHVHDPFLTHDESVSSLEYVSNDSEEEDGSAGLGDTQIKLPPLPPVTSLLVEEEEAAVETSVEPREEGESRTEGLLTDEQKEIEKEGGELLHGWAEEEDAGLDGTRRKIPLYLLNPNLDINGCIRGGVEKENDKEKGMFRVVSKIKIEEEEMNHDLTKDEESKHQTDETTRLPADNDADEKLPNPSQIISDDTNTRHRSQPHPTEKSVITSGGGFFRTQFVMAALFLVATLLTACCSKDSFAMVTANWSI